MQDLMPDVVTDYDIKAARAYDRYYLRGYKEGLWDANYCQERNCPPWPGFEHGYDDAYRAVMKQKLAKLKGKQ